MTVHMGCPFVGTKLCAAVIPYFATTPNLFSHVAQLHISCIAPVYFGVFEDLGGDYRLVQA